MVNFSANDLVYVPWPETAFAPARVVSVDKSGEDAEIRIETTGAVQRVPASSLRQRFVREDGVTSQDNTSLVHMNDATILENLESRHAQDEIYTYTASVLLAVNPYKDIKGLYGDEQCARYKGKHIGALPPHPYAIADTAYRALVREGRNQGLLISGESGAGKTETAKIVMQFLAYASGTTSSHASSIQARVLRAQPILESMGNAVTMRNSNSSRFGKYNRVFFDEAGSLVDAGITTYLLESSRVVVHSDRERTYHCFYEMLHGLEDGTLEKWGLQRNRRYRLLTSSCGGGLLPGFESRDAENFRRMCDALGGIGLGDTEVNDMFGILAGLIHLGEVEREAVPDGSPQGSGEEAQDTGDTPMELDEAALERAAALLGMEAPALGSRLTKKKVAVRGRSSYHEVPRSATNFRHALQSFIKAIYKRLFDHIVARINASFADSRPSNMAEGAQDGCSHIGILDIYGFENLQRNSFEQLCINLANERLQQYFVENVLRAEQELYTREGLPWIGLPLPDATPVFSAIGQVFKTLDEYSQNLMNRVGNPTDKSFCQKVLDESNKDSVRKDVLKQLKMTGGGRKSMAGPALNEGFIIKHYAGQVEYKTCGWLDKNNDRLLTECEELICESSNDLVQSLGDEDSLNARAPLFKSISKKYVKDLEALLETLSTCNLHYIRCFKPNGDQKPNKFEGQLVLDQIVQCGTIELVKIMHDGYPNRCPFDEIVTRFRDLLPERFQRYGMRTFIEALMLAHDIPKEEWALGMSRLFLKAGQLRAMESMRSEGVVPPPEKLDEIVRGIVRKRWARAGHAVRLCNYLPKFAAQIYLRRASKALAVVTLTTARLAGPLAAAKERVKARKLAARRRLVGAISVVRLLQAQWRAIRARREARLARALRLATLLHVRTRPWVALARERAAEEAKRREAERRREEERRRAEEERQRKEREALEAEKKRLEEERLRREEEQRLREEEQRRAEAEQQRLEQEQQRRAEEQRQREEEQREREEALRRELEKEREEERQRAEAERKALELERRQMEEERQAWEEQKRQAAAEAEKQRAILEVASPSKARPLRPDENPASSHSNSATHAPASDHDDLALGDSVSQFAIHSAGITQQEKLQMEESLRSLQRDMLEKHEEIKRQMALLQEKNASLEHQLNEERAYRQEKNSDAGSSHVASPVPRTGDDRARHGHLQTTPTTGTPASKKAGGKRSAHRLSMVMSGEGPASASRTARSKRHSVASEALGQQHIKDTKDTTDRLPLQREWWAEQRQNLLDDLFGGPLMPAPRSEIRNLNSTFETEGSGGSRQPRPSTGALREPTQFKWNKRQSLTRAQAPPPGEEP